jgi:sugar phosphate isomerase/epimerase
MKRRDSSSSPASRRGFLTIAGASAAASLASWGYPLARQTVDAAEDAAPGKKRPIKLALASYTLRKFDLEATLEMTQRLGLKAICLKSFHLPMDASAEEIAAVVQKTKDAGIHLYGGGVIGMKNVEQVDRAFEYAKAAGMIRIIAAPTPEMLPLINEKVQQYDIQVCIHNHGPGDKHFPTPELSYEKVQDLDARIGFCHDIGHTVRYGRDAVAETEKCGDRMLDFHLKDVTAATKAGHATPCGRGIIDLPAILRTLVKIGFSGYAAFEYEADPDDPMAGLAESVGYIRGVMDAMVS